MLNITLENNEAANSDKEFYYILSEIQSSSGLTSHSIDNRNTRVANVQALSYLDSPSRLKNVRFIFYSKKCVFKI